MSHGTPSAVPTRMRAVTLERHGAAHEVLSTQSRPRPEPGPGEVRIKLILSPIHTHDLEMVRGEYGHQAPLPTCPGSEAVGYIDALGPDVTHLHPGQRVVVAGVGGAWAEYFLARARSAVPVPDDLPDECACQLLSMPLSTDLLLDSMALQAGDWILHNCANGTVGRLINVLAPRYGAQVLNLVRSVQSAQAMRADGYSHVLSSDQPDWPAQVPLITGGAPVMHGIDSLGGEATNALLGTLATGGTLVSFGSAASLSLNLHVEHLLYREITVRGFWAAPRYSALSADDRSAKIQTLIAMGQRGELPLRIAKTYSLNDAAHAALAACQSARHGKVALRPCDAPSSTA